LIEASPRDPGDVTRGGIRFTYDLRMRTWGWLLGGVGAVLVFGAVKAMVPEGDPLASEASFDEAPMLETVAPEPPLLEPVERGERPVRGGDERVRD
jgi:hypothetical protein